MSLNSSKEDSDHLSKLQEQNGEEYEDAAEEVEDMAFHHQSLQVLIVSLAKTCPSDIEPKNEWTCMLDETCWMTHSSNIYPKCRIKYCVVLTRP